jgi:hypothetical protein
VLSEVSRPGPAVVTTRLAAVTSTPVPVLNISCGRFPAPSNSSASTSRPLIYLEQVTAAPVCVELPAKGRGGVKSAGN